MHATTYLLGLSLAALHCALAAQTNSTSPVAQICDRSARWVDDDHGATAAEFEAAFEKFDAHLTAFSQDLASAYSDPVGAPDAVEIARLRLGIADAVNSLGRLIPLRDAGNDTWPMKFLLEDIPGGVPLPDFHPIDRAEVLRAAFMRELADTRLPGSDSSPVRFLAYFEMAFVFLHSDSLSATDRGALEVLAGGALAEAYEADFRQRALRVLGDGWHTSLASRLQGEVRLMCSEAPR